jgi:hypothetical protein
MKEEEEEEEKQKKKKKKKELQPKAGCQPQALCGWSGLKVTTVLRPARQP